METSFIIVLAACLINSIGPFSFKVAASHNYPSELFVLTSSVFGLVISIVLALHFGNLPNINWLMCWYMFVASMVAAIAVIIKVYALRAINTTIFLPIFSVLKIIALTSVAIVLFNEQISLIQWLGIGLGTFVPLLLINKAEQHRQTDLVSGLLLMLAVCGLSLIVATTNKYTSIHYGDVWMLTAAAALGMVVGSLLSHRLQPRVRRSQRIRSTDLSWPFVGWAALRAVSGVGGFGLLIYAYTLGASLAVAQTVQALAMLVPIVLSVWWFGEHWSKRKILAAAISVVVVGLLQ